MEPEHEVNSRWVNGRWMAKSATIESGHPRRKKVARKHAAITRSASKIYSAHYSHKNKAAGHVEEFACGMRSNLRAPCRAFISTIKRYLWCPPFIVFLTRGVVSAESDASRE